MTNTNKQAGPILRLAYNPITKQICAPVLQMGKASRKIAHRFPENVWTLEMSNQIVVEEFNSVEDMEAFIEEFEIVCERNAHLLAAYARTVTPQPVTTGDHPCVE